ncbi:MAG: DUF2849 domain-containing protein [Pseudomonadota bacterium]
MARAFSPKIVSANDLMDGDVVYLAADARWSRDLSDAAVAETPEAAAALLERANQPGRVVGPVLIDVALTGARPEPTHLREKLRERGPSNRPDLGRQAERAA